MCTVPSAEEIAPLASPSHRPTGPMMVFSAAALALAAGAATVAIRRASAPPGGVGAGRCEVTATVSVTADVVDRPVSVVRGRALAWALVVAPGSGAAGAARARVVRVPDEGAAEVAWTGDVAHAGAISNLVATPEGVAFAVARGRAVTGYALGATGPARERSFPRGESPPGRDAATPSLALAADDDGALMALARWPAPWGTRRISTRDVREGGPMTPRRRDVFARPDLAVAGDVVVVAEEHHAGSFVGEASVAPHAEVVVMDAAPAHPDLLATLCLPRDAGPARWPRVAADPASTVPGAVLAWRDAQGIAVARVTRDASGAWGLSRSARLGEAPRDEVSHDVSTARGRCGAVGAWRDGDALVVRAVDLDAGAAGAAARAVLPAGVPVPGASPRVRVERGGDRVVVATDTPAGVRAFDVAVAEDCAVTLAELALPAGFAGARLAGAASAADRVVLAASPDGPDAAATRVRFATLAAVGGVRAEPPAETLPQGVTELGLFAGGIPVVAGRARGSVMLRRVGDPGDVDEPGEDLLLREMRGVDLALAASAARHRVWVADVSGDEETPFGPAGAVVVHSAIDTLEDGPRTEVRTATVPEADFPRMTLAPRGADGLRGATWSGAVGAGCVPGAWASRHDGDDRGIEGSWRWMVPLVAEGERACGDRVHAAVWRGAAVSATLTGARIGARLVTATPGGAGVFTAPLDERAGARVRLPAVTSSGEGLFAAWLDGDPRSPAVRCRWFTREGRPRGEVMALGEITEAPTDTRPDDALPLAAGADGQVALVLRTAHGPRLARIACGAQ
jgi:hypothetical protein